MKLLFLQTNSPLQESGFDAIDIENTYEIYDAIADTFAGGEQDEIESIDIDFNDRYFNMRMNDGSETEGIFHIFADEEASLLIHDIDWDAPKRAKLPTNFIIKLSSIAEAYGCEIKELEWNELHEYSCDALSNATGYCTHDFQWDPINPMEKK